MIWLVHLWVTIETTNVPDTESSPDSLRVLGKLKGLVVATLLNFLKEMKINLTKLLVNIVNKQLYVLAIP